MACGCAGKSKQKAWGSPGLNLMTTEEADLMAKAGMVQIKYTGPNKAPVAYVLNSGARIKVSGAALHNTAWVSPEDAKALLGSKAGGSFAMVEEKAKQPAKAAAQDTEPQESLAKAEAPAKGSGEPPIVQGGGPDRRL